MPNTAQHIEKLAASARPTTKGQVITLDVYVYPNGTSGVRAKGITGLSHSLQCNHDEDFASIVTGVMQEMRDNSVPQASR